MNQPADRHSTPVEPAAIADGIVPEPSRNQRKPIPPAATAPGPMFIAPQTIDRRAFDDLSRTLAELIGQAERACSSLRQSTEHAAAQRAVVREDLAKQKGHIGLVARLLRAVDQRTKQLDAVVGEHFVGVESRIEERLLEVQNRLGIREQDLEGAITRAVGAVERSVGSKQAELAKKAETLKADIEAARARHATTAQKQVDDAAKGLVSSIKQHAGTMLASIEQGAAQAMQRLQERSDAGVQQITKRSDESATALEQSAQGVLQLIAERASDGETTIESRAAQSVERLETLLANAERTTTERLASVDRFAGQAVSKVESRIAARAQDAEKRAGAAADLVKDTTASSIADLRAHAEQQIAASGSSLAESAKAAHQELDAAFDDRMARLESTVTARRAQLIDQLDKAEARLRMMEKIEQRVEDKAARMLDGLEQRVRERADAIFNEAETQITTRIDTMRTEIEAAERRHRDLIASVSNDADHRIDAFEALFEEARATLGIDPDDLQADPAPGSLGDLLTRAGEMLEHLHIATARLSLARDDRRREDAAHTRTPGPTDRIRSVRDANAGLAPSTTTAHDHSHEEPAPDGQPDEQPDPLLDAIERLRASVLSDLDALSGALRAPQPPQTQTPSTITPPHSALNRSSARR